MRCSIEKPLHDYVKDLAKKSKRNLTQQIEVIIEFYKTKKIKTPCK